MGMLFASTEYEVEHLFSVAILVPGFRSVTGFVASFLYIASYCDI
jgi:hypothetical protein